MMRPNDGGLAEKLSAGDQAGVELFGESVQAGIHRVAAS